MQDRHYMKYLFILILPLCLLSCTSTRGQFVELGTHQSKERWVYLCGLAESFDSPEEQKHRQILDNIGRKLNITFIALIPRDRCPKFDNKICWPHKDQEQVMHTYQSISRDYSKDIAGWIGFSNGGYFLHELSQNKSLTSPIITIGAAPSVIAHTNQIYIMIGKQDTYAYNRVKNLKYKVIEYEGSHEINQEALQNVLIQARYENSKK